MNKKIFFVSGIDTDCGKTYVTSHMARIWHNKGVSIITQKPIQTGCVAFSDDLMEHRRMMGSGMMPEDLEGRTCSYLFPMAASPHLAARMEGEVIDIGKIEDDIRYLSHRYDYLVIEGAGGLMVPMTDELLTIDFIKSNNFSLILVVSDKLGSINHTLLSIEACVQRGIAIHTFVYNRFANGNSIVSDDTLEVVLRYLIAKSPMTQVVDLGSSCELEKWCLQN